MTFGGRPMSVRWDLAFQPEEGSDPAEALVLQLVPACLTAVWGHTGLDVAEITRYGTHQRHVIGRRHRVRSAWWSPASRYCQRPRSLGRIVTERHLSELRASQRCRQDSAPTSDTGRGGSWRCDVSVDGQTGQLQPGTVVSGPGSVACSQQVFVGGRLWSGPTAADTSPHSRGCGDRV